MRWPTARRGSSIALLLAFLAVSACTNIGPKTITRDRLEYIQALRESWKRQILLNVVALRYAEAPVFLEVGSVINQYSLETNVDAGVSWGPESPTTSRVGAYGRFSDRPTITYTPLTGERYVRSMLTPIPPTAIIALVQSGWPADFVVGLTVQSINGITVPVRGGRFPQAVAEPPQTSLLERLRSIQMSGAIGMRLERQEGGEVPIIFFAETGSGPSESDVRALQEALGLATDRREYRLTYGAGRGGDDVIVMLSRSMIDIMLEMSSNVEVPSEDLEAGRASVPRIQEVVEQAPARIRSSDHEPESVFAKVHYRSRWFYIEDGDLPSKRTLSFLMLLLSLSESSGAQGTPVVTVGAGG